MRRVLVLGNGGSGKSTFARNLARITGLPLIHLDRIFWQPGWKPSGMLDFSDKLDELAEGDSWILDGNYAVILDSRIERADTVFFLDFPVWFCILRVFWRVITHLGRTRFSMAPGCPEKIDKKLFNWIRRFPNRDLEIFEYYFRVYANQITLHRFKSQRQADAYLRELRKKTAANG